MARAIRPRSSHPRADAAAVGSQHQRAAPRDWRCAARDSGQLRVHAAPFQRCGTGAGLSITPGASGKDRASCGLRTRPAARDLEVQRVAVDARRGVGAAHIRWAARPARARTARRARGGLTARQLQRELAVFGDALVLADQPVGCAACTSSASPAMRRGDGHRHRQQHRAFVAVVDQRSDRQLARRRPVDVAGRDARGQRPLQRGRQAGVAGVLPVGVPVRLVLELQAQPDGLAGADALGRVRHQLGAHLLGLDDAEPLASAQAAPAPAGRGPAVSLRIPCIRVQTAGERTNSGSLTPFASKWGVTPFSG